MRKTIFAIGLVVVLLLPVRVEADTPASASSAEALLARLETQIPKDSMASPTPEINELIRAVGATKRLDAALTLIRALAFSLSPIGQGESFSPFGSMPAAQALKANFGSQVLPILMFTGVTTKEGWVQTRLALVIREIGTEAEIKKLREAFSTDETKDPAAKRFAARLMEPNLSLADDPALSQFDEIHKMIEEALKKQREAKDKPKPPASNS
jgi:hypothetical protein